MLQEPARLSQPAIVARVERMAECLLEYDGRWCHNELKALIVDNVFPFRYFQELYLFNSTSVLNRQMASLINKALSKSDWVTTVLSLVCLHCVVRFC